MEHLFGSLKNKNLKKKPVELSPQDLAYIESLGHLQKFILNIH